MNTSSLIASVTDRFPDDRIGFPGLPGRYHPRGSQLRPTDSVDENILTTTYDKIFNWARR